MSWSAPRHDHAWTAEELAELEAIPVAPHGVGQRGKNGPLHVFAIKWGRTHQEVALKRGQQLARRRKAAAR